MVLRYTVFVPYLQPNHNSWAIPLGKWKALPASLLQQFMPKTQYAHIFSMYTKLIHPLKQTCTGIHSQIHRALHTLIISIPKNVSFEHTQTRRLQHITHASSKQRAGEEKIETQEHRNKDILLLKPIGRISFLSYSKMWAYQDHKCLGKSAHKHSARNYLSIRDTTCKKGHIYLGMKMFAIAFQQLYIHFMHILFLSSRYNAIWQRIPGGL